VVVLGRTRVREYDYDRGVISVGRDAIQDVAIDNPSVSRSHCQLAFVDGRGHLLEDLGSENGTLHNGRPVRDPVELAAGDEIGVGKFAILYNPSREQLAQLEARPIRPVENPAAEVAATTHLDEEELARVRRQLDLERGAHLRLVGRDLGKRVPLYKAATVLGRGAGADVQLAGWLIAARHAVIRRSLDGRTFRLTHEEGLRRVRVNGRPVRHHELRDRDRVTIGGTTLQFFAALG
jgi:pSer/pThr/pTyr-binding forkhead associated (FHA) protein